MQLLICTSLLLTTVAATDPVCEAHRQMHLDTGCCGEGGDRAVCVAPHVDVERGSPMPEYARSLVNTFSTEEAVAVKRLRSGSFKTSYPYYDKDVYVGPTLDAFSVAGAVVQQSLVFQHIVQAPVTLRTELGFGENPFNMGESDYVLAWGTSASRDAATASTMLSLRQNLRDFEIVTRAPLAAEVAARASNGTLATSALRVAVCKSGTVEFVQADWYVGLGGDRSAIVFVDCSQDEFTPLYQAVADGTADYTHLATFYPDSTFLDVSSSLQRVRAKLYSASKGVYVSTTSAHHDDLVTVWKAIIRTGIIDAFFEADNRLMQDNHNLDNASPVDPKPQHISIDDTTVTPTYVLYKGHTIQPRTYTLAGNTAWTQ